MTKRFKNVIEGNFVLFYDGDEQIPFDEVEGVLNSLNDENEQLKKQRYDLYSDIARLVDENEQLKQFIQELTTKGTGKIHLANGSIYKVDAILIDFKGDVE